MQRLTIIISMSLLWLACSLSVRADSYSVNAVNDTTESSDSMSDSSKPIVTIGIFIGKIEESARIFTPIRLLPFDFPESQGHEFPNALQLHQAEYEALVYLGELVGLKLTATLQRYPKRPTEKWWYDDFAEFPVDRVRAAAVIEKSSEDAPIPGVKVIAYTGGQPIKFVVDTRQLSLEERHMDRATTSGLDLTREQFLAPLRQVRAQVEDSGDVVLIFK